MAIITFGDILTQCQGIAGIRSTETDAIAVLKDAINTGHAKVMGAAVAEGFPWMLRMNVPLAVAATDESVVLPDGTTVYDTNTPPTIAARCSSVVSVKLASTGRRLSFYSRELYEAQYGRLQDSSRGTPQYFDPYGIDTSGRQLLWLMPMTNVADTVYLDYLGDVVYLTNTAQALLVPDGIPRHWVAQESIACVNARDTVDQTIIQKAMNDASYFMRLTYSMAAQYKAVHPSIQQILGRLS